MKTKLNRKKIPVSYWHYKFDKLATDKLFWVGDIDSSNISDSYVFTSMCEISAQRHGWHLATIHPVEPKLRPGAKILHPRTDRTYHDWQCVLHHALRWLAFHNKRHKTWMCLASKMITASWCVANWDWWQARADKARLSCYTISDHCPVSELRPKRIDSRWSHNPFSQAKVDERKVRGLWNMTTQFSQLERHYL